MVVSFEVICWKFGTLYKFEQSSVIIDKLFKIKKIKYLCNDHFV